ncbi:MAG: hypothetical protein C4617_04360 [Candidatus Liberibacter europaeus]|uniref:VWFA domain-containing protein n=1 Tax=Candidatus Liberibacter europaeus TaxID=744859 RepID=A0A2T4VWU6_9HYPH|nr:hypothetical protein [Candidatus Liberibacter europaeus]PTL86247.1 MAG: hypothetical protein C4617_04360 [Candidatus Liberibacter europaeus]
MFIFNKKRLLHKIYFYLETKNGMFLIITSFVIMIVFCFIAFAIDISRIYFIKHHIKSSIDNSILRGCSDIAASKKLNTEKTHNIIRKSVLHNISQILPQDKAIEVAQNTTISIQEINHMQYNIELKSGYQLPEKDFFFGSLITRNISNILCEGSGSAIKSSTKDNISIQMVLDVSESMNGYMYMNQNNIVRAYGFQQPTTYNQSKEKSFFNKYKKTKQPTTKQPTTKQPMTKIQALKKASLQFIDSLQNNRSNERTSIRVGLISYNDHITSDSVEMSSNLKYITNQIKYKLKASGATNTFYPMQSAYNSLIQNYEIIAHGINQYETLKKFIIFMTDGENSNSNLDYLTLEICQKCRDQGVKIYTILIGNSIRGEDLLRKCSNSAENFYSTTDSKGLIDCFENISDRIQEKVVKINPN